MSKSVKRVLYIDHTPFAGGAQLVLAQHIQELDRQHFDPYVICSNTVPELIDKYKAAGALVEVIQFPRLRGFSPIAIGQFVQAIRRVRHIIHHHQINLVVSNTTRASYVATLATWKTNTPVIWWVRDFLYPRLLFKLLRPMVAKVIFVSKAVQAAYMTTNDPKAKVVYVASSMYKQLPQVRQAQIVAEKQRWGITQDEIVVGFMGRLVADKGVEEVVAAARLVRQAKGKVKFLIVGTGKNQMNNVEDATRRLIAQQGLESTVIMTGYQSNEPLYYSLFDIFVLPTRDGEPFATSVIQAMMAGNAVIGSSAGGTPELVVNRETGLLFDPRNASQLAQAITTLAKDTSLRHKLAQTGKQRVLQYHREETVTDQIEDIFKQVLKPRG